jgi:DNA-binding MurR/RpiR family transcriptional regulator
VGVLTRPDAGPDGPAAGTVADRLRRAVDGLAPAERRVVRALLRGYPLTGLEPLAVVAAQASASAPTVLRVMAKLGFAGYPDFQRNLRAELAERWTTPLDVMPRGPVTGLVDTVREAIRSSVAADLDRLAGEPELAAAAQLLTETRHAVWAVGGRFSSVLAEYLTLHLQVLRPGVHRVPGDPGGRHTALLDVARRDVVVAFDYRRYQHDTVEFGARAVAQGARLVLFTDRFVSPLAADAGVVLTTSTETSSPFAALSPALAAVELVLVSVVDRLGGAPRARMERYDAISTEVSSDRDHPPADQPAADQPLTEHPGRRPEPARDTAVTSARRTR